MDQESVLIRLRSAISMLFFALSSREFNCRLLADVPHVSTTAFGWSSYEHSYLGVTAHWIDETTLARKHAVLAMFRPRRSSRPLDDMLAKAMTTVHSRFGLQVKVRSSTMTDNDGSNIVKTLQVQMSRKKADLPPPTEEEEDLEDDEDPDEPEVDDAIVHLLPTHMMRRAAFTFNLVATADADKARLAIKTPPRKTQPKKPKKPT